MSVQKQKHISVVCTHSLPYPAPFFCQETQSNNKRNAVASSLPADKINTPNSNNNNKHGGLWHSVWITRKLLRCAPPSPGGERELLSVSHVRKGKTQTAVGVCLNESSVPGYHLAGTAGEREMSSNQERPCLIWADVTAEAFESLHRLTRALLHALNLLAELSLSLSPPSLSPTAKWVFF